MKSTVLLKETVELEDKFIDVCFDKAVVPDLTARRSQSLYSIYCR